MCCDVSRSKDGMLTKGELLLRDTSDIVSSPSIDSLEKANGGDV